MRMKTAIQVSIKLDLESTNEDEDCYSGFQKVGSGIYK
jgi:hypothetical protein